MSEIISNSLFITAIDSESTTSYYFSLSAQDFFKFYQANNTISYSPSTLNFTLMERTGIEETSVQAATIELIEIFTLDTDERDNLGNLPTYSNTLNYTQDIVQNTYLFPAKQATEVNQPKNIVSITLRATISSGEEEIQVAYEEIPVFYGTNQEMAKFAVEANKISGTVANAGFVFNDQGLTISNGYIQVLDKNNDVAFRATTEGDLFYKGEIQSSAGSLGGWIITENELHDQDEYGVAKVGLHSGNSRFYLGDTTQSPVRFWAGTVQDITEPTIMAEGEKYNFAVTQSGTLYANAAIIQGDITANSGRILNDFYVGDNETGIIIHGDSQEGNSYIGSVRYASGKLGGGWTINSDGSAEFNNVSVRGKIASSVFEYGHISSVGGSLYIAPTVYTSKYSTMIELYNEELHQYKVSWILDSPVSEAFGAQAPVVEDYLLLDGDVIVPTIKDGLATSAKEHISNVYFIITEITYSDSDNISNKNLMTGYFEYTGSYDISNCVFEPGAAIVYYGKKDERNGLYLTAMDKDAPYIEVYHSSSNDNDMMPSVRLGNLQGIEDKNFVYNDGFLSGYGLYSNNAFLRGQLMLPNAGITNQTETVAENGSPIRIWAGINPDPTKEKSIANAYFKVTEDGTLYAEKGVFKGIVEATNSQFSGSIRAAGIILEAEDNGIDDALHDHFFVAQKPTGIENNDFIPSYLNYILNIDREGLSIWSGGLQTYSDAAELSDNILSQAYRYDESLGTAFPYFYLVDQERSDTGLNSRIISTKGHFINFIPQNINGINYYSATSVSLNNGIQFYNETREITENYRGIEDKIFNTKETRVEMSLKENSFILTNNKLNGTIDLSSAQGVTINKTANDEGSIINTALFVRGNMQIVNNTEAEMKIGSAIIQEVKNDNGTTIGLNFISRS